MNGAGAERVVSLLSNHFIKENKDVSVIITSKKISESDISGLNGKVSAFSLIEMVEGRGRSFISRVMMFASKILRKIGLKDYSSVLKFYSRNYDRIKALNRFYKTKKSSTVISFLYDAMFLSLLSSRRHIKLVISERADPCQLLSNETDAAFIYKMFSRSDEMVFQSPDVLEWYRRNTKADGKVIFNPIKPDLPQPYQGERSKDIVNFCRITEQKNLTMLIKAFSFLCKDYPDYRLLIYGNADNSSYFDKVLEEREKSEISDNILILPARNDIHEIINDCVMFVSSSDYEGMSNSMLEAMAMGMPVVCTDCPAGGARAVINDHENGLLVPVGDAEAFYKAMKEIIENPTLAKKLGENASKIKETQSVEKITEKWMEVIG